MSYKSEARKFLEKSGIDPDIFDWDIPEIMADFARIKVGEQTGENPVGKVLHVLDGPGAAFDR